MMAIFYVYLGQETGFAGWISSYVVILNLDTERGAARFPAIFWVTITMLRFVFAGIPGKSSTKLKGLIFLQIICYFIATCMFYSSHEYLAAYWTSITIGIAYSSMYPMAYTLPMEFNQKITESQTATIMLIGGLGEGTLTTITGYLIKIFGPQTLFTFLLACGFLLYLLVHLIMENLKKNEPKVV